MENNALSSKASSFRDGATSRVSGGDLALHQHTICGAPALNWGVSWSPKTDAMPVSKGDTTGMKYGLRAAHSIAGTLAPHSPGSPRLPAPPANCGCGTHTVARTGAAALPARKLLRVGVFRVN